MSIRCLFLAIIIGVGFSQAAFANNRTISLDLYRANLTDSLRLIAKSSDMNLVFGPSVRGMVTLHLHQVMPSQALEVLLKMHGLSKWKVGDSWWIATRQEFMKGQLEEVKWQTILEETMPLTTTVWQLKYGNAKDMTVLLQEGGHASLLSKRGSLRVDKRTNAICIQDIEPRVQNIRNVIRQLDVPIRQILVEVRLANVDHDYERELGLTFPVKSRTSSMMIPEMGKYSLAVAALADGSLLDVKLSALENEGHAELISTPSLFTGNQQPASIEAGEEVPYQEVSESGGTAAVFKKAVLGLKVTPQVLPGDRVLLKLQINQDRPSAHLVQGVPTINTRQITTNVIVKNHQTIVLGGIFETNEESGQHRLPFLSDVPLLGSLLKQNHTLHNKRELLIFVTPKMMNDV